MQAVRIVSNRKVVAGELRPGKLLNLQAGRAIAATLVVLFHCNEFYVESDKYWSGDVLGGLFHFGEAGVMFFFVLSGYIMMTVHWHDVGRPDRLGSFVRKRFERIYPFYWIMLFAAVAIFVGSGRAIPSERIIGSAALFGIDPLSGVLFVSWTLFHELLFYAVFALIIVNGRIGFAIFALWMAACIFNGITGALGDGYTLGIINILFAMGVVSAALLRRDAEGRPWVLLFGGLFAFTSLAIDHAYFHRLPLEPQRLAYGLASLAIVVALVRLEREGRLRAPRWLVFLGEASYAIYLSHMLILPACAKAMRAIGLTAILPATPAFAILTICGLAAGCLLHVAIERPLLKLVKRRSRSTLSPELGTAG